MGQVRDAECEKIDSELRAAFPGSETDCRLDTYTQDYIIWIAVKDETYPVRITRDEYLHDDWKSNIEVLLNQQ